MDRRTLFRLLADAKYPYEAPGAGTILAFKSWVTTGSMSAGSNQLTVTSNPGFLVNDPIIVEIGGEADAGLRGTKGVGGTWPALSYATVGAMNADTSKAANTYAWVEATGDTYQYVSGVWTSTVSQGHVYYATKAIPRALVTTISAINGLVFTLGANATVATTATNVYFDNAPLFNVLGAAGSGAIPTNNTYIIPAGTFAVSDRLLIDVHHDWTIRGYGANQTMLFSPKGVPSAYVSVVQSNRVTIREFHLKGNAKNNGFGLAYGQFVTETSFTQGHSYPKGVAFTQCDDGQAINVRVTNVFQAALGASYCVRVWAYNCHAIFDTDALQGYLQWLFEWSDSVDGGIEDCTVDSPYLTAGFEIFRSSGVVFRRFTGRNATVAVNSSGNWIMEDADILIEPLTQISETSFSANNPVINVNSNIQPPDATTLLGGQLINPCVVQLGAINASGAVLSSIIVNVNNPNITVTGGYPYHPERGGYIEHPSVSKNAGSGVESTGANTVVDGIRVVGVNTNTAWGNIHVVSTAIVRSCIAQRIIGGTRTNNLPNPYEIVAGVLQRNRFNTG